MALNFSVELDSIGTQDVMGIYGAAHLGLIQRSVETNVPCMADQLKSIYGDSIYVQDLTKNQ